MSRALEAKRGWQIWAKFFREMIIKKHRSWCRNLVFHVLAVATVLGGIQVESAVAQVLDQRVTSLLLGNCAGLGFGVGTPATPADLAPNLFAICDVGPGNTSSSNGTSAGGGAASVQAAAVSILNRNIMQRLAEDRAEAGQPGGVSVSSLAMNPFGMLGTGLFNMPGMASPSSPAGDSSGASFNLGSGQRWKGLGFFASGLVESLDRDVTTFQDGYKSTILGFTAGADYRFSKQAVAGLAFNYSNTNGDFRNSGNFSTNSYGVTLFGAYYPTDRTFLQMIGGYTNNNYLVARPANVFIAGSAGAPDRVANGFASSNSNGDVFNLGLITGYDYPIGRFTIGPRAGFNYSNTHIHDFQERGGTGIELKYADQYVNSLQSVLGFQGSTAISTNFGVLVPQVNADYIHEFANSQRRIDVQFVEDIRANPLTFQFQNEIPVRNYFNLGAGLIAILPNGLQPWVNFRAMVGNEQFNNYAGTFGLRVEM